MSTRAARFGPDVLRFSKPRDSQTNHISPIDMHLVLGLEQKGPIRTKGKYQTLHGDGGKPSGKCFRPLTNLRNCTDPFKSPSKK